MTRMLEDMGKVVQDGNVVDAPAKAPEAERNVLDGQFVSMGENARFKREAKEREEAKAKETPKTEEKAKEEPPKTEPKTGEATPPPAAATPPAKPKIIVEKAKPIEEIVEGVVRRISQEKPAEPPAAEAPAKEKEAPAADPDAAYVESLDDAQKEEIELAEFAAKAMPEKYGAMKKRTVDYLKKVDEYIDSKRKEDPDWDPDSDDAFEAFIEENRPTYQSGDRRKLERQQITEEVTADVEKKFKPKIEATERATRVQEIKPEVDKAAESYAATVAQRLAPDDKSPFAEVMKVVSEKGMTDEAWKEAEAVDALAAQTAQNYVGQANVLGREYLELVGGVSEQVQINPKEPLTSARNQKAILQQRLFSFIDSQEQIFAREGGDMRIVNGRSFVTRAELSKMPAAERAKHWTLGHDDVLDMLAVSAATSANQALQAEVQRREKQGYVRNGKGTASKKETPPAPPPTKKEESPKATVTPGPGAGTLPPPPSAPTVFTEDELKKQWEGGAKSWLG